ncbi:MAG: tetratricopeptide repeat protein [Gemmatirosa sp.]
MTTPNHRTATAALDAARPLITRLDATRHPEEVAADLIEAWSSVETSLRALLGGSALGGQALVGEVRQRGLLDYRHAHDLLGFLAARDRATRQGYRPDHADVDASRTGFQSLEAALGMGIGAPTGVHQAVGAFAPPPHAPSPGAQSASAPYAQGARPGQAAPVGLGAHAPDVPLEPARRRVNLRRPSRSVVVVAAVALAAVLAGAYWWATESGSPRGLERGVVAYQAGQKDIARREFQAVADDREELAIPHVWLARLAREDGDLTRATTELQRAIQLEPTSAIALREMGQLLLQSNRPDLAVNFLRRAIEADNTDRVAQGWMACALARQGNAPLAQSFAQRAGQGDWSGCVAAPAMPMAPGQMPGQMAPAPGAYGPGALPPGGVPQYPAPQGAVPRP